MTVCEKIEEEEGKKAEEKIENRSSRNIGIANVFVSLARLFDELIDTLERYLLTNNLGLKILIFGYLTIAYVTMELIYLKICGGNINYGAAHRSHRFGGSRYLLSLKHSLETSHFPLGPCRLRQAPTCRASNLVQLGSVLHGACCEATKGIFRIAGTGRHGTQLFLMLF